MADQTTAAPVLLDAKGQPVVSSQNCPRCGAGPKKRMANCSFGPNRHPVCSWCGHEFVNEAWHD